MKNMNARLSIAAASLFLALGAQAQTNVGINANGQAPVASALLDIDVTSLPAAGKKGLLIPRMTAAQRAAIAGPVEGLIVYQTDATRGFYFYDGALWIYLNPAGQPWAITGNFGTNTATEFVGSTSAQPIAFGTTGAERMRIDLQGDVGVGQTNPIEKLDVAGAIRLTGTSATSTAGTIRWNGAPNNYHEGNMTGTATGSPTGWRKMENDYQEVFGAAYSQPSAVTCASGGSEIGPWTTYVTPGPPAPTSAALLVTPYPQGTYARVRHQYLFRAQEINLELNQLFLNPNATMGLCAGQPIDSIAFYVTTNPGSKNYQYNVVIKHTSLTAFGAAFDNSVDPAQQCYSSGASLFAQPTAGTGWKWYRFSSPFYWDGTRNIIIDFSISTATSGPAAATVWCTTAMSYNCTYGAYGAVASCPGVFAGAGTCTTMSGTCNAPSVQGAATQRPVIRFNGITSSAAPGVTGTGKYINFNGGFIQELSTGNWGTTTVPQYAFKGPGKISSIRGVYDNGVKLNDHVFDRYFDGRVDPQDAALFGDARVYDVDEMVNYVERERHLPTMKGREAWERERGFSLGDLGNQLWTTMETHALYLTEMNDQAAALRVLNSDGPIRERDFEAVKHAVGGMADLTEQEKQALIRSCEARILNPEQAR